jgi:hypothetical protein
MLKVNEITNVVQLLEFSENHWFRFFEKKIRIKELLDPNISKNFKENSVFMKEPVILWLVIFILKKFETCSYISKLGL